METWKELLDWPYEVSDTGKIRRCRDFIGPAKPNRQLKPTVDKDGYLRHVLCNRGTNYSISANRAVALAFHGRPPSDEHEAAHRDGDKKNNSVANIYWATSKQNCQDNALHGTQVHGSRHPRSKLSEASVAEMRAERKRTNTSYARLAVKYGVSVRAAYLACTGRSWARVRESA